MPNYKIHNETPGVLSLAPLRDLHDQVITLGPHKPSCEVDEATYENEVMQRMIGMKWVKATPVNIEQHAAESAPPVENPPLAVIDVPGTPEEGEEFLKRVADALAPEHPEAADEVAVESPPGEMLPDMEPEAPPAIPVEGPVSSETPLAHDKDE